MENTRLIELKLRNAPDAGAAKHLVKLAANPPVDTLLLVTGELEPKSQKAAWVNEFERQGMVVVAPPMTHDNILGQAFDALLEPEKFRDYGPNGLQVEGDRDIQLLVSGVTASRALIEAAIAAQADAIVVHHGLFWRGQDGRITGWMRERLRLLLTHGIHLFAYHLPLDAHPEWGNNAQLARVLGLQSDGRFGEQDLGFVGSCLQTWSDPQALADHVALQLGRAVTCVGGSDRPVRRVAWCTGGAQGYFEAAIAQGVDAFITGEISEPQAHLAQETGVAFLACGHHATERYGAPALAAHVAQNLGLQHRFIEIDNPA
jgi:dinuclear metal center YbgI/SA1388 family protein